MVAGRINKDGKVNRMAAGKANKTVDGRISRDGKANKGGKANKNSNINLMKGGKVNGCSHGPSSGVPLNYQQDLREMADNRE